MKKSITLLAYRRTIHKNIPCPDGQVRTFPTYRIAFQNGKGKIYHASVLYWYKQEGWSVSCCSCPAQDYKRSCYHRELIMKDPKLQKIIQEDKR